MPGTLPNQVDALVEEGELGGTWERPKGDLSLVYLGCEWKSSEFSVGTETLKRQKNIEATSTFIHRFPPV